jgi:hypothetical protein
MTIKEYNLFKKQKYEIIVPEFTDDSDGNPDEVGRQDPGAEDQHWQPGLLWRQPPQEQHGSGGGDGDAAASGRNRFEFLPFMLLCMSYVWVCTMFDQSLPSLL